MRSESDWARVTDAVLAAHGKLDILINNAGITGFDEPDPGPQDPEHVSLDTWRSVMATNAEGVVLGCKHAIRAMRTSKSVPSDPNDRSSAPHGGGSIVNIASRSGVVGVPRAVAYAASKAAVAHHTRSVALYCAEERLNIRCNAIQPAAILTPMWDPILGQGPDRERVIAEHAAQAPLNRFGTPEEVASLAVYLVSDESAYTTGTVIDIDGGMRAGDAAPPPPQH